MTVKATYNGMTYEFPDGTPDDVIYSQIQQKFSEGNKDFTSSGYSPLGREQEPTPQGNSWGFYNSDDGSILQTAWDRLGAQAEAMVASGVEDPERSRYAMNKYTKQYQDWKDQSEKLGVAGNVAAGIVGAAPAIAGGVLNPAVGASIMGSQSMADALIAQQEEGQDFDRGSAGMAGLGSMVTDATLGRFGAKLISRPGAGIGAKVGQVAVEDAGSNAASMAYENLASGRDWNANLGEAALIGAGAGTAVRGSLAGMNKAMNFSLNKSGEKAINDNVELKQGPGPSPSSDFSTNYAEHSNAMGGLRDNVMNASDPASVRTGLDALNNQMEKGAHLEATARFAKALQKNNAHIIDSMYDTDIELPDGSLWNIGVDGLNLTKEDMTKARENVTKAQPTFLQSGTKELEKGLTGTAFNEKSQIDGRKIRKDAQGYFDHNATVIEKELELAKARGEPEEKIRLLTKASKAYGGWLTALHSMNKEADAINTMYTAQTLSREINDSLTQLGLADKIKDMNGETGNLNPFADFQGFTALTNGFRKQNKQFTQGKPDTLKPAQADALALGLGSAAWYMGNPLVAGGLAARQGIKEGINLNRRRKTLKSVETAKSRLSQLTPAQKAADEIAGGDPNGAKMASVEALQDAGITVPNASKIQEPMVEPTRVEEPIVEAPVSPVQATPARSKADARTRPAPTHRQLEKLIEKFDEEASAPAPKAEAPKPEAKAAPAPQKSKAQIRKENREKARVEREAKKQAEQARIAAELQEKIQAGQGRRATPEAKAATAPKAKETPIVEEPVVEAPVETPKEKPKAKVKRTPKEKAPEVKVEEPTPEPAIEIPADVEIKVKPQAKAAKSPKPKEEVKEAVVEEQAPKPEAKAAKAPKQKEQPEVVEEVKIEEPVVEPTVETPKPKPKAKASRTPKKKEATPEPEAPQEAPQKAPTEPLGRKQPTRTEEEAKPVEELTEAPVKAEEPEVKAEEPKVERPDAKVVRAPMEKIIAEEWPIGRRHKDPKGYTEYLQAKTDFKTLNNLIQGNEKYSADHMAGIIEDMGGMRKFMEAAKEAEASPASYLNRRVRELEILSKQEASKKVQEMKDILESQKAKEASQKKETPTVDKEDLAKKAAREEFEGELEARGIHADDIEVVKGLLDKGTSIKNAREHARRLTKERKERMENDIKDHEKVLAEQKKVLESEGKRAQVDEYLRNVVAEDIPEIKTMVSKIFKHAKGPVSDAKVQKLLNDIDDFLDKEVKRYNSLTRGMSDADPRMPEYEAAGLVYQNAQRALKTNRNKVDKKYDGAHKKQSEEAQALQKREAEYDRLFREADTRDANLETVVRQKEAMREELRNANVDDSVIEDHIKRTFYKREATPMNPRELRKNMLDFFDAQARSRETRIEKKKRNVDAAIEGADSNTLIEMSQNLVTDPDFVLADDLGDSENFVAMAKALREAMEKKGLGKEAVRLETMNTAILEGLENKAKYPDNPELWVPTDPFLTISRTFGTQTSSYRGNLGVSINLMVTGNKEGLKGFGTLKRSEMIAQQKKLDGEKQGALITDGIPDVVVR